MSKELDALTYLKENKRRHWLDGDTSNECLKTIERGLNVLELFKNALRLNTTQTEIGVTRDVEGNATINYETTFDFIKNTLDEEFKKVLREWVLENACPKEYKALKIIKNKKVDMTELLGYFEWENGFSYYNEYRWEEQKLTKEEYEFLKEVFKDEVHN